MLKRVVGLRERAEVLLSDMEATVPAKYREVKPDSGDLVGLAWGWSRASVSDVITELGLLASILRTKIPDGPAVQTDDDGNTEGGA